MTAVHSEPQAKPKRRKKARGTKPVAPIESVRRALERMKPQLELALPPHLTADRLLSVVLAQLQSTPALLECDRESLCGAVLTCAQLGLEPDAALGQASLVPSRGRVQLVPGYRGFLTLARNSGQVLSINVQEVHREDHFDYAYGLNERLEHVPAEGDRGDVTHFYAYVKLKDGGHCFEVLSSREVEAGWAEDSGSYAEKGKLAVLRRIAPHLPLTVQKAMALADLYEPGRHIAFDVVGEIVAAPTAPLEEGLAPEPVDLTEDELAGLFPPSHIVRILDAMSERGMPDEILDEIVGVPLEEVPPEDEAAILRTIASWRP
jgi:recombination protein RecT